MGSSLASPAWLVGRTRFWCSTHWSLPATASPAFHRCVVSVCFVRSTWRRAGRRFQCESQRRAVQDSLHLRIQGVHRHAPAARPSRCPPSIGRCRSRSGGCSPPLMAKLPLSGPEKRRRTKLKWKSSIASRSESTGRILHDPGWILHDPDVLSGSCSHDPQDSTRSWMKRSFARTASVSTNG